MVSSRKANLLVSFWQWEEENVLLTQNPKFPDSQHSGSGSFLQSKAAEPECRQMRSYLLSLLNKLQLTN